MKISRIIGIDPGLSKTGWGLIELRRGDCYYLDSGFIATNAADELSVRLLHIFNEINKLIVLHHPEMAALEETYVNVNSKTSLHLAHARAASIIALASAGLFVKPYPAKTIKKTLTGTGNADKEQVAKMLMMRLINCAAVKDHNAIDALALAFCHANFARF